MTKKPLNTIREALDKADKSILWLKNETAKHDPRGQGISYSLLHSYYSQKREPGLENLFKIASALKINPKQLINS